MRRKPVKTIEANVVLYNDQVSSEGYVDYDKAVRFIETRSNNPKKDAVLEVWKDECGDTYRIKPISVVL